MGQRPASATGGAAPTRDDEVPLVGRTEEMQVLRRALASPETRLLTLTGPPGVGKSRLALAAAISADGRRVTASAAHGNS